MKGVLRDVPGTFVELSPEPPKEPPGQAPQPPASEPPAPKPTAAPPAAASEPDDPLIDRQVDEALGKVASQKLVEFLTLYDNLAFIPSATDRVRAVLVAKGLSVQAILELFAPQLTAIGRIQSSFASTLGTKLAQADALAQAQKGEADAAIAAAREQIAALEGQIKSAEEEKARATAALERAGRHGGAAGRGAVARQRVAAVRDVRHVDQRNALDVVAGRVARDVGANLPLGGETSRRNGAKRTAPGEHPPNSPTRSGSWWLMAATSIHCSRPGSTRPLPAPPCKGAERTAF